MKNLHIIFSLIAIAILSSCGNKAEVEKLDSQKDSLSMVVAMKDSIINEAFINIDEIASSLNQIAEREKLVTKQSSGEITASTKEQINENIAAISELLIKNQKAINKLAATSAKLKAANVQIAGLQNLVASLKEQLAEKNSQIESLAEQLKALNIEVTGLVASVKNLESNKAELEQTVSEQTEQLNNVYYVVGLEKDLMDLEVIDKQGVIGRTSVVGANSDLKHFTKGDLRNIERISIGAKKVKIVTSHPQNSYMLVMGGKNMVEELVITDRDSFWKNSKILIISHK